MFYYFGIHFFTSGGGSKAWRGDIKSWNPEVKFYHDRQGFMSVQITEMNVDVVFYDVLGKVLHRWSISKELKAAT
ncbi:putative Acid phosphatase [Medicago truncatula]|uniref:Putative Acid phosphatase n=1 Tax=Medicago truncatula TaxID=3880 RepID=A0A396GPK4_MEDTR|nr:putative Acid phosphatase [Medicago truncatula]